MMALTAEMGYLAFLKNGSLRRKKALINPPFRRYVLRMCRQLSSVKHVKFITFGKGSSQVKVS